ncbi:serine protease [Orrella sp. JC864]|uniref:S1 family peptidase n=1 Tax=Orrella sp. JC864 TaxID=3120298 RepID=UPI0030096B16
MPCVPSQSSLPRRIALAACLALGWAGTACAAPSIVAASALQAQASGVFLNAAGDVLTARHAVRDCESLFVIKDAGVSRAVVKAQDEALDLAVLGTTLKPYLSATFVRAAAGNASQPVFAEAYSVLQTMPQRASTVFNAMILPGRDELSLLSPVQPGASGTPVLGSAGLLLGVVVERVALDGNPSGRVALSRARSAGASTATRVKAVPAERIKAFLRAQEVDFSESDLPQLGPLQAQAPRAATLSVGIICG